ncbi:bifunctional serine/threonine-protein kinase/universal stress protein [Chitinimonas sp. BJYL2]|uniref:serine/threonine protein kinase n=1 Tax=Chitinimonas sp. BJYL2 TaxID=2976696 RepID=UPI0022B3786C|nr:bifunctional serine/threonine-protein kinase/universal stress protein [Chitinimonas sp. BJYL2]
MARVDFVVGQQIDEFTLEEKLAEGGMAAIWRVTHPRYKGPMVMKLPKLRGEDDPTAIVGFETEQMILPRLHGVHVPAFIASGDFTAQPYLVMERIAGPSLRERLDDLPLPVDEVASIGARVAEALHDLHRQQVIHLDIKPSNILFRPDGTVVLVDFGLARHDRLPDLLAEEFRLPLGTGPYLSPEQVLHDRNEPRSDLFALGVMLYYLLTGERPFGFPTSSVGIRRRLWRDPLPPLALRADCPPWLQEVILRCLAVNPEQRYATAAELAMLLRHPDQIALTDLSRKREANGRWVVFKRWFHALGREPEVTHNTAERLDRAPIVMAAVEIAPGQEALNEALLRAVKQLMTVAGEARLACVSVLKTPRIAMEFNEDEAGRNLRVKRLVALRYWAASLGLPEARITFHVLASPDPAAALIDFAGQNQVDHLIMGARESSALRRHLGSTSSRVVAEAACSVTVVRRRDS